MNGTQRLLESVRKAYSLAAERPGAEHPFPVGRSFAESVGYPVELLSELPPVSIDSFTGVSNVSIFADIPVDASVLDLGCGAGLDSLIAAQRVGPEGRVTGIDFSKAMLARARRGAAESGLHNAEFIQAGAGKLPVGDSSIDVALVNGIFNLNPVRQPIFCELARVVRPGGSVYAAELILREAASEVVDTSESNWST